MKEFEIIATWFSNSGCERADVHLGVGDDAALITLEADQELVTASACALETGAGAQPEELARRCFEQASRRLEQQRATPAWALLCLCLAHADRDWLRRFSTALHACLQRQGIQLIGGDTTRGPTLATLFLSGPRVRADRGPP